MDLATGMFHMGKRIQTYEHIRELYKNQTISNII